MTGRRKRERGWERGGKEKEEQQRQGETEIEGPR